MERRVAGLSIRRRSGRRAGGRAQLDPDTTFCAHVKTGRKLAH